MKKQKREGGKYQKISQKKAKPNFTVLYVHISIWSSSIIWDIFLFFLSVYCNFGNFFFWASSWLWNLGLGLEIGSRNNSDSNPLLCKKITALVVEVWFIRVRQQRRRSEWEGKGQPQWSRRGSAQLQEIEAAATAAVGELWRPMSSARLLKQSVE